ncbi:helix-turn-helix domain-containing protein [Rhodococcus sp. JVH1]|uniref:helix-turn-helix domain-containing protein n=1 Tax=Rhodococcus sp. JVH1 TaxID=745408 RepID=UPI0002720E30|nr:helix-turn-helix domain-containing protein [Rhodococcus sp. JVH1]EJI95876.1 transcriptional regulator, AraC family [Rhodococcus sp. JVH1]
MVVHDVASCRPGDRFEFWREVICREFTPLTPTPSDHAVADFAGKVEVRPLGATNRAVLGSQPQHVAHGAREVAEVSDGVYFVNVQLAGRCHVRTDAGSGDVSPGQLTIVDTKRPYWFDYDAPWRLMSYQVPHIALARLDTTSDSIGRPIDTGSGVGLVLASLMRALWEVDVVGSSRHTSEHHLERSFFSAVEATLCCPWSEPSLPPNSIRTAAIDYVRGHLGDPSLSVPLVANALAISPRALHYAFSSGESFASSVRTERLEAVARALRDPRNRDSVSHIAARYGFLDASSFSRAFRCQYSMSPRDYRFRFLAPI